MPQSNHPISSNQPDTTQESDVYTDHNGDYQFASSTTQASTAGTEKLQKALARMGLGSRRQMEEVIKAGRVSINQKPATIGDRVEQSDEIRVDGRLIKYKSEREKRRRVLAYYKPEGEICSANDPEGRTTVFERLPKLTHDRWIMVGRLDINSTGLLLFTNDGELAHRLMHPSNEIVREYAVRILGELTPEMMRNLTDGVMLEDGLAKFEDIRQGGGEGVNKWYHVKLKEGRNREVRRLIESQGLKVSRLLRTSYGSVDLPKELRTGRFIELDRKEIHRLIDLVGIRPREDMGVHGKAKEKKERFQKKPLKARTIRTSSRSGRAGTTATGRNSNPSSSNTRGRDTGNRGSKR
ncbi:23S rRNA pseudouridine(2605) synthase RluB [Psychrobacter sanguinis]|uniref:23S rRNA pseudouridine(2605) synthase RluB n=1 Tax=Psychrobacter sanguinis TaxID=861445 RepID=UPI0002E0F506|nr:23S rRNA pseudouridine(2605) synthase RluB [Psychrobacter sanguinis]MCC3306939.1 23S rRNA pseudouridine(2605) synthase RluB [Psychrobacter sanguinis]UEC26792.1 23S rRNA pseudouridine(2605) synthase RluB [Psychrobacter sanguinis]